MTPPGMLQGMQSQQSSSPAPSNNLFNSISGQGMPAEDSSVDTSQEPTEQNGGSPAEQAIGQFKQTFDSVQSLLENPQFSMASQEADLVKRSLQNWLETVVTSLSNTSAGQEQGGESLPPQAQGATPPNSSSPTPNPLPSQSGAGY